MIVPGASPEQPLELRGAEAGRALEEKRASLHRILAGMGRTLVAYSGGVDSAFLLEEAARVLGPRAQGVIAASASLARSELRSALELAASRALEVRVVETREMDRDAYRANRPDRCYHCKAELFERLGEIAREEGWDSLAYGALTDDLGDIRPGMSAAERYHVRAPLLEAGLGKLEVRILARAAGLPVWNKPQSACLSSRIPHGSEVTAEKLLQVERGEAWLRDVFRLRVVRLRHEGPRARIEVSPADIPRLKGALSRISKRLCGLGFLEVEIDPRGYSRPDPQPLPLEEKAHAEP